MKKLSLLILLCLIFPFETMASSCWEGIVADVTDGNTLIVNRRKTQTRVGLYGIDAPAKGHMFAAKAQGVLQELVLDKEVTVCPKKAEGVNGAEVHVLKGFMLNINREMVRKGLALKTVDQYAILEKRARTKKLGLWSQNAFDAAGSSNKDAAVKSVLERRGDIPPPTQSHNTSSGFSVYKAQPALQTLQTPDNNTPATDTSEMEQRQQELESIRQKEQTRVSDTQLSLTDIEDFKLSANFIHDSYEEFSGLEINFYYWNNTLDSPVDWNDGEVYCECRVTGHFSEGTNTRIAKTNVSLSSFRDRVYIDIPSGYLEDAFIELLSCTVECRLSAGIFDLKASHKVYLQFTGRPWLYQRQHHY